MLSSRRFTASRNVAFQLKIAKNSGSVRPHASAAIAKSFSSAYFPKKFFSAEFGTGAALMATVFFCV
jgi:hypothetical protein